MKIGHFKKYKNCGNLEDIFQDWPIVDYKDIDHSNKPPLIIRKVEGEKYSGEEKQELQFFSRWLE